MRRFLVLGLVAAASLAFAGEGALGTKKDIALPQTGPSAPTLGGMQILQMLVALAIVVGLLKFVLPKLASKFGKKLSPSLGSSLKLEESAAFPGGQLYVVQARRKTLLLAMTQQGVTCLADLTDAPDTPAEPPAFFDLVDAAHTLVSDTEADLPTPTFRDRAVILEDVPAAVPDFSETLRRIERLEGRA